MKLLKSCYFPTKVIFVDDEQDILVGMKGLVGVVCGKVQKTTLRIDDYHL